MFSCLLERWIWRFWLLFIFFIDFCFFFGFALKILMSNLMLLFPVCGRVEIVEVDIRADFIFDHAVPVLCQCSGSSIWYVPGPTDSLLSPENFLKSFASSIFTSSLFSLMSNPLSFMFGMLGTNVFSSVFSIFVMKFGFALFARMLFSLKYFPGPGMSLIFSLNRFSLISKPNFSTLFRRLYFVFWVLILFFFCWIISSWFKYLNSASFWILSVFIKSLSL